MLFKRVLHRGVVLAESFAEPVDQTRNRIDRQHRLAEVGRVRREVDGGQFVQTHDVIGDHDLGGHVGEALACLLHGPFGLGHCLSGLGVDGVVGIVGIEAAEVDLVEVGRRGFVTHVRYPTEHN